MATLSELDTRLASLEALLATTKRIRELTLTQTQNPATTLSGGVFSFDGGGFVIPNVADGLAAQDVATVNQAIPINTVLVRSAADLPATTSINIPSLGTFDFHTVTTDTQFILFDDVAVTAGISVNLGVNCIIRSANKNNARFLPNFGVTANQVFFHATLPGQIIIEDVTIEETSGQPLSKSFIFATGASNYRLRNVLIKNFPAVGEMGTATFIDWDNNVVEDLDGGGLEIVNGDALRILNNVWEQSAGAEVVRISGTTAIEADIRGNKCTNLNTFFLAVDDTIDAASRVQVANNSVTSGSLLNSGAGFLDESDKRIIATDNIYQASSRISARLFVTNNTPVAQTPLVMNVPKQIVGFTFNVDGIPQRFEVTTNMPGTPLLLTYKGEKAMITIIFESGVDGSPADYAALGIFKNGNPLGETFIGHKQPATSAQPTFQVTNIGIELAFNDTLSFGIENQTGANDILITNPVIFIASSLTSF